VDDEVERFHYEIELVGKKEYVLRYPDSKFGGKPSHLGNPSDRYCQAHWRGIGHILTLSVEPQAVDCIEEALATGDLKRIS